MILQNLLKDKELLIKAKSDELLSLSEKFTMKWAKWTFESDSKQLEGQNIAFWNGHV